MKKIIIVLICSICISTLSNAQKKLPIDINESSIKWIGEYTFYFGGHEGLVNFKKGHFVKTKDVITGGEFIIDMNSFKNTDIKHLQSKNDLIKHLKDSDFFDVKKYPLAKLIITKVEYSDKTHARLEADLTIKEITKPINFSVEFNYDKKEMKTRFKIDRRKWGVNYKSKLRDYAISDAIGFEATIKL